MSDTHENARFRLGGTSLATNTPDDRRSAARFVASQATDAADCVLLLEALGLTATDGLRPVEEGQAS